MLIQVLVRIPPPNFYTFLHERPTLSLVAKAAMSIIKLFGPA